MTHITGASLKPGGLLKIIMREVIIIAFILYYYLLYFWVAQRQFYKSDNNSYNIKFPLLLRDLMLGCYNVIMWKVQQLDVGGSQNSNRVYLCPKFETYQLPQAALKYFDWKFRSLLIEFEQVP